MTAPAIAAPSCPKCQGPVWDQLASKFWGNGLTKNGKQKPRWECKNKDCGGAVWDKGIVAQVIPKPNPAKTPTPSHANVPNKDLPDYLRDAEAEDTASLAAKVGVDLTGIQSKLAIYQGITEWYLANIPPIYEKAKIGCSPESAAAGIHTLFITANK